MKQRTDLSASAFLERHGVSLPLDGDAGVCADW